MFSKAIVCAPGPNFEDGLTIVNLGVPNYNRTLAEYSQYLAALKQSGLTLIELPADPGFPDGTFVEDTTILVSGRLSAGGAAILTRPGAESRAGEVQKIKTTLSQFFSDLDAIRAPGNLDGGDVCEAGSHFFIGISLRTNESGASQLADWLRERGFTSSFVDIRQIPGILHLKSGIAYLGDNRLVLIDSLARHSVFQGYEIIHVSLGEDYAANCIRVNENILVAAGFPRFEAALRALGYKLIVLDMSEFQKMDGGLSCLSLRF